MKQWLTYRYIKNLSWGCRTKNGGPSFYTRNCSCRCKALPPLKDAFRFLYVPDKKAKDKRKDSPGGLLSQFVEEMDLTALYATYERIRNHAASPKQMLKIVLYAAMNRMYSSRDIETACRRDINFMFLLEGMPDPDHATIARFRSHHFSECSTDCIDCKLFFAYT